MSSTWTTLGLPPEMIWMGGLELLSYVSSREFTSSAPTQTSRLAWFVNSVTSLSGM